MLKMLGLELKRAIAKFVIISPPLDAKRSHVQTSLEAQFFKGDAHQ